MEPNQEAVLAQLTQLPQGMVLLTGPTGSGKTTTLYTALAQANDEGRKIITFEDPIEYQLEGTVQIQVREQIGLTFASGLRSVLRHDPDVVLVGEIRDFETAEIAVRAAQTGHLVFSTLHTNDSVSAVTRLLEMRIEAYLIASSLVCSISQRLARRICRHCAEEDLAIPASTREEMAAALSLPADQVKAWKGRGCVECNQKGHRGRVAIYEFFLPNEPIRDLIQPGSADWRTPRSGTQTRLAFLARNGLVQSAQGADPHLRAGALDPDDRPCRLARQKLTSSDNQDGAIERHPLRNLVRCSGLGRSGFLLPRALGRFDDEALLQGVGRYADVAHFAVHHCFHPLKVWKEAALGDGRDVRADTAGLLRFAAAPDDAALHRALACQFTNSRHTDPVSKLKKGKGSRPRLRRKLYFSPDSLIHWFVRPRWSAVLQLA